MNSFLYHFISYFFIHFLLHVSLSVLRCYEKFEFCNTRQITLKTKSFLYTKCFLFPHHFSIQGGYKKCYGQTNKDIPKIYISRQNSKHLYKNASTKFKKKKYIYISLTVSAVSSCVSKVFNIISTHVKNLWPAMQANF